MFKCYHYDIRLNRNMLSVYFQNVERSERSRLFKYSDCFEQYFYENLGLLLKPLFFSTEPKTSNTGISP